MDNSVTVHLTFASTEQTGCEMPAVDQGHHMKKCAHSLPSLRTRPGSPIMLKMCSKRNADRVGCACGGRGAPPQER